VSLPAGQGLDPGRGQSLNPGQGQPQGLDPGLRSLGPGQSLNPGLVQGLSLVRGQDLRLGLHLVLLLDSLIVSESASRLRSRSWF
ncbi:unnamed protein product, partial [Callosobruchus maculatus]